MAYKMLINGKLVDGAMTMDVFNPATGGVLATCPRADEAQLNEGRGSQGGVSGLVGAEPQ